jgi:hypothetical protein
MNQILTPPTITTNNKPTNMFSGMKRPSSNNFGERMNTGNPNTSDQPKTEGPTP